MNIEIVSLNENKVLYSDEVFDDDKILLEMFSLKILEDARFLVESGDKKLIVFFNEIFELNYFEYIILNKNNFVHMLTYFSSENKKFELLLQNNMKKYLFKFIKNIFYLKIKLGKKNKYYLIRFLLTLFVFSFVLKDNRITTEGSLEQKELFIQKNIYNILKKIDVEEKFLPSENGVLETKKRVE